METENISGEELYRRFMQGDAGAFEALVELYQNDLSRFIYSLINDYHETKHITIEAFAQLALGGRGFTGKSSLKTYLFTIAKNLAARCLKARAQENTRHIPYEEIADMAAGGETPHELTEREENRRELQTAMQKLKEEHRTVLTLLYFEDMSYLQAGRAMNKSEKQIKHLAFRAKAALKRTLESADFVYR